MNKTPNEMHPEGIIHKYLRWSKRIAFFGLIQWSVISFIVFVIIGFAMKFSIVIDEYTSNILKNIITASSGLSMATSLSYMGHSSYETYINKKLEHALGNGDSDSSGEG